MRRCTETKWTEETADKNMQKRKSLHLNFNKERDCGGQEGKVKWTLLASLGLINNVASMH